MKLPLIMGAVLAVTGLSGCTTSKREMTGNLGQELHPESFYLPNADASRVVTVTAEAAPRTSEGGGVAGGI
jgi:hypothetical protein